MVKGVLVDVKNSEIKIITFEDKLEELYRLCDCQYIDITMRKIGEYEYDIVCDDEGLLKEGYIVSAIDKNQKPMLVGNLIFCNHDEEGNLASLKEEQIVNILKHTYVALNEKNEPLRKVVGDLEYC